MPLLANNSKVSSTAVNDRKNLRSCSRNSDKKEIQKLHELKSLVGKAICDRKTFTVLGPFSSVQSALKIRGWFEKFYHRSSSKQQNNRRILNSSTEGSKKIDSFYTDTVTNDFNAKTGKDFQISRLLKDHSVDFIWTMKNEPIKWKKLSSQTIVSRFPKAEFTTKLGLCNSLQQSYWYHEDGVSKISFPRCYEISNDEESDPFIDDFRQTACNGMVKFVHDAIRNETSIFSENGIVPISSFSFAVNRCLDFISYQEHKDIDKTDEKVWNHQWDQFLTSYYSVIHDNACFHFLNDNEVSILYSQCERVLEQLTLCCPQLHIDGMYNLWILKPAAKSRGRGIHLMKKLEDIKKKVDSNHTNDCRYVIQKYIERPLLIYETKFDIRQWFLVTSAHPLTIWMYKESYLRFCSQNFSLVNTHESIHLSNNAIQCKYKNGKRDQNLPDENMWDCYTFQAYLRSKGVAETWESIIYPQMRQNIIAALLASQETMGTRKNCFELYGADFMLDESYMPWLIEINSGPSMSSSTSVTARMCAQVLEDVIKVVVDKKADKNATTGMFELVYKQIVSPAQPYTGQNLVVLGTKIETKRDRRKLTKGHKERSFVSDVIRCNESPIIKPTSHCSRNEKKPERKIKSGSPDRVHGKAENVNRSQVLFSKMDTLEPHLSNENELDTLDTWNKIDNNGTSYLTDVLDNCKSKQLPSVKSSKRNIAVHENVKLSDYISMFPRLAN